MYVPSATYRIQFSPSFGFKDAEAVVPYLRELGISDIYASPIFRATEGSTHGYDVTNPNELNPELGSADDFSVLTARRNEHKIGWLQDIVPNHMAYTTDNQMLMDVFRNGRESRYADFFDITWDHPDESLRGKVLAPFLGKPLSQAIADGEIILEQDESGMYVRYYDIRFPLSLESCRDAGSLEELPPLESLLEKQFFRLCYWKKAAEIINYRRFFYLNDFISLQVEKPEVFDAVHKLISKFVHQGAFTGLRIDHIDGLHDPAQYLAQLCRLCGDKYVVVEKILDLDESLPENWSVQGTSGYDFCNYVNEIFIRTENQRIFTGIYHDFINHVKNYEELLLEKKRTVCSEYMAGEVDYLVHLFYIATRDQSRLAEQSPEKIKDAIVEIIAAFKVYRTYVSGESYSTEDKNYIEKAVNDAGGNRPDLKGNIDLIGQLILLDSAGADGPLADPKVLDFVMKFQQLTGPVMAKGFEDTLLYNYNRLISLNEVGAGPERLGISLEDFHKYNAAKAAHWPRSLNATSTHDTKRGEDVRARINVLTEMPEVWSDKCRRWKELNSRFKTECDGESAPDANDEYVLYQTLIGAMPFDSEQDAGFNERIKKYMLKVVREAKEHGSWTEQNEQYERACEEFVDRILDRSTSSGFLEDFLPFQEEIAAYGIFNSLSQTLLKMTSPGVPDFYQGSELWDLNLVDPDNRRPVDFEKRKMFLDQIRDKRHDKNIDIIDELLKTRTGGRIKMFLIYRVLNARRQRAELFEKGDYQPLTARGKYSEHVVGFLRKHGDQNSATIAPRFLASLIGHDELPLGTEVWRDTQILLPGSLEGSWRDALTGESVRIDTTVLVGNVLSRFPVSLLIKSC